MIYPVQLSGRSQTPVRRLARTSVTPTFGSAESLRQRRLMELFDNLEKDMAEGRILTREILGPHRAVIDINGKEYDFYAGDRSWSLHHEVKTDTARLYKLGFLKKRVVRSEKQGIELSLARKFFSDGYRVEYSRYVDNGRNPGRQHLEFVRDEQQATLDRAWTFFHKLADHVFTDKALKPFISDRLAY